MSEVTAVHYVGVTFA